MIDDFAMRSTLAFTFSSTNARNAASDGVSYRRTPGRTILTVMQMRKVFERGALGHLQMDNEFLAI